VPIVLVICDSGITLRENLSYNLTAGLSLWTLRTTSEIESPLSL
jgi:hypothetical protein